ncbi:hypothetical protein TrLO_g13270 [Triparma laevis f. longispina]|uniref:Uncharacterized protein n=1 Tax=Triparma laevis f. longispina TaxID=1714387 RepID=A0A9W7E9S2_9STRA|nr:hypothetical protein TrLO_g13270 [Triparma laevis f. longispina]
MPYEWTDLTTCLNDHKDFLLSLPLITLSALTLSPSEGETVHLSVNSVTSCPYCTGLHGNLGRMAGLNSDAIENAKSDSECASKAGEHGGIALYAREFAFKGYDKNGENILAEKMGSLKAKCVTALCQFLKWGSYGGNTINSTLSSPTPFNLVFTLYYGPLFVLVKVVSGILSVMPTNGPKAINIVMSLALPIIAGFWIVPVGILGVFWPVSAGGKKD